VSFYSATQRGLFDQASGPLLTGIHTPLLLSNQHADEKIDFCTLCVAEVQQERPVVQIIRHSILG
jgi:hypothetical protein